MAPHPKRCRICSRQADVDVRISKRGLCQDCALVRIEQNAQAMIEQAGPQYDEWVQKWQNGRREWLDYVEILHTRYLPPSGPG